MLQSLGCLPQSLEQAGIGVCCEASKPECNTAVHVPAMCSEHTHSPYAKSLRFSMSYLQDEAVSHPAGRTAGQTGELGVNGPRVPPASDGWELEVTHHLVGLNPPFSLTHLVLISFPSHLTSLWPPKFPGVTPSKPLTLTFCPGDALWGTQAKTERNKQESSLS